MNYLSVCSGIEAATVAWHNMGWKPVGFSEIEKFPSQVLAHHYPEVTNYGDMTKFKEWNINEPVNLLVGGTPCQSFSVAGLRKGLDDPRGNLMLTFLAIANHYKPKWIVWENVPGVLSSNGGKDFATFLGALGEIGYGFAYRVLDAQYFGVAQRRRRVFVVGCLGDWRSAAAVLFDSESLRGNPAPSRKAGERVADTLTVGANQYSGFKGEPVEQPAGNANELDFCVVAKCLTTGVGQRYDPETESLIPAHAFKIRGGCEGGGKGYLGQDDLAFTISTTQDQHIAQPIAYNITFCDANGKRKDRPNGGLYVNETEVSSTLTQAGIGTNVAQPITIATKQFSQNINYDVSSSLLANDYKEPQAVLQPIGFEANMSQHQPSTGGVYQTLTRRTHASVLIPPTMAVRRLTPTECERLQGFPDGYTDIQPNGKPTADGPRYKALGNSMAVPVMKWIGERIDFVDKIK